MATFRQTLVKLLVLAAPLIAAQIVIQSQGLFITSITAKFGTEQIAAYSLSFQTWVLITSFYLYFMAALGVIIARGDTRPGQELVAKTLVQGYIIGFVFAAIITYVLLQMDSLFLFFGEPKALADKAGAFCDMLAYAPLPFALVMASQQFAIALDRTDIVLAYSLIVIITICGLSYLFTANRWGIPNLGMEGLGLAISVAYVIEAGLWLLTIARVKTFRPYRVFSYWQQLDASIIKDILRTGVPLGTKQIIGINGLLWFFTLMLGKTHASNLAVFQILIAFAAFSNAVPDGLSRVASVRISRAIGLGDAQLTKQIMMAAWLIVGLFTCFFATLMLLFPEQLIELIFHSKNSVDPETMALATQMIRPSGLMLLVSGLVLETAAILTGFKDTKILLKAEVFCMWLIALPIAFGADKLFHGGIICYWPALFVAIAVYLVFLLFRTKKRYYSEFTSAIPKFIFDFVVASPYVNSKMKLLAGGNSKDAIVFLEQDSGNAIARVYHPDKELAAKTREVKAASLASESHLGPDILYIPENKSGFIMSVIVGKSAWEVGVLDTETVEQIAKTLRQLHSLPSDLPECSLFSRCTLYWKTLEGNCDVIPEEFRKIKQTLNTFEKELEDVPRVFCHNDLNSDNIWLTDSEEQPIQFIDWADSGLAIAEADLAMVSILSALTDAQIRQLHVSYLGREPSAQESKLLAQLTFVSHAKQALWSYAMVSEQRPVLLPRKVCPTYQELVAQYRKGAFSLKVSEDFILQASVFCYAALDCQG